MEQPSLCTTTIEERVLQGPRAAGREASATRSLRTTTRVAPTRHKWREPAHSNEGPVQSKLTNLLKKEILPSAATWMDLETAILSEVSLTEKKRCPMTALIYGIHILKKIMQMNLQNRKRLTDLRE